MAEIVGIGVSPGRAVGPVVRVSDPVTEPPAGRVAADDADPAVLADRISIACGRVRDDLSERAARVRGDAKAVLEAAALMAVDPVLVEGARRRVSAVVSPAQAVWEAAAEVVATLTLLGGYLAQRARDVADVRNRIVAELSGLPAPRLPDRSGPYVLVARDLAPADAAMLEPSTCVAVATAGGGPTSHTSILLRSLGIPAVVAARDVLALTDDTVVLVDGSTGTLRTDPGAAAVAQVRTAVRQVHAFDGRGRTADGHPVRLMANVGGPAGVDAAVAARAEGVGLFRTEFCFLDHTEAPTVEEQTAAYRRVLAAFPDQRVVM